MTIRKLVSVILTFCIPHALAYPSWNWEFKNENDQAEYVRCVDAAYHRGLTGDEYAAASAKCKADVQKRVNARTAKATAQAKKPGVRLGMTPETVINETNWGKPQKINRSVGSWGVHEQWVYNGGYLYFENGKLTSWQN